MGKNKKITLFPTKYIKKYSDNAMGTATISRQKKNISLNLYNLPGLERFENKDPNYCYKAWLINPQNDQILTLGQLKAEGDGLYILYDVPINLEERYTEILITAEPESATLPGETILLIGYLSDSSTQPLEQFKPFNPPLPLHNWWKLTEAKESCETHYQCPYQSSRSFHPTTPRKQDLGLPRILGTKLDEEGNVEYFVHGIPGRFLRKEQPDQGQTGYLYWRPYYGIEEKVGALGYWLCYLNPKTNQITTPMGVTIPPD